MKSEAQIKLHRMYIKNSLFETAALTQSLLENTPPLTIDLQVYANSHLLDGGIHEATVTLQVSAKHNGSLIWRVQLLQAGQYTLQGLPEELQKQVLNGFCINQLYPHACAAITQMVVQSGFPAVYLQPMNFEQLYKENLEKQNKEKAEKEKADKEESAVLVS